jgi:alkanesulfonate monooxygenase SsuD/methylene tetrahydromethanopterin reductase-like flavin-dependent oxidoreductase (luciferase family)
MSQVEFGLFDWIDRGVVPVHQLYAERLQLLEAAETAGFFCYHLAEHHATPLGMAPSPALFLSAAAQRTRRIRLGPLVYLLPLYNPLRLIEEICMLDQLSGGRLELGIGRGVTPYELNYFGVDPAGTRAIFDEALAVLVAGLTTSRLTFAGTHYQYSDVPMELHPLQRPYPRCGTRRTTRRASSTRRDTASISLASAPLRLCAIMSMRIGRPGRHTAMNRTGSMAMSPLPKSVSCAR